MPNVMMWKAHSKKESKTSKFLQLSSLYLEMKITYYRFKRKGSTITSSNPKMCAMAENTNSNKDTSIQWIWCALSIGNKRVRWCLVISHKLISSLITVEEVVSICKTFKQNRTWAYKNMRYLHTHTYTSSCIMVRQHSGPHLIIHPTHLHTPNCQVFTDPKRLDYWIEGQLFSLI